MGDTSLLIWLSVENKQNGCLGIEIQTPTKDG